MIDLNRYNKLKSLFKYRSSDLEGIDRIHHLGIIILIAFFITWILRFFSDNPMNEINSLPLILFFSFTTVLFLKFDFFLESFRKGRLDPWVIFLLMCTTVMSRVIFDGLIYLSSILALNLETTYFIFDYSLLLMSFLVLFLLNKKKKRMIKENIDSQGASSQIREDIKIAEMEMIEEITDIPAIEYYEYVAKDKGYKESLEKILEIKKIFIVENGDDAFINYKIQNFEERNDNKMNICIENN